MKKSIQEIVRRTRGRDIATALAQQETLTATGQPGDFIAVGAVLFWREKYEVANDAERRAMA